MDLKKFLKPDWRKIVIFVILFIIFSFLSLILSMIYICSPSINIGCPPLGIELGVFILLFIISFFISYLLSCLIIWIYDKVKK